MGKHFKRRRIRVKGKKTMSRDGKIRLSVKNKNERVIKETGGD